MKIHDEDITAVSVPRYGVLEITFADGTHGEVEVIQYMQGTVFTEARTPEGFAPDGAAIHRSPAAIRKRGGGGGIRTHERLATPTVFETAPFNHSGTPPRHYEANPNDGESGGNEALIRRAQ